MTTNTDIQPRKSKLAITSIILSILGFIMLFGIDFSGVQEMGLRLLFIGPIFGIIALIKIIRSKGRLSGKGFAKTGITLGVLFFLSFVLLVPETGFPPTRVKVSRVKAEQASLATALEAYYIDNNHYPLPDYDGRGKPIIPKTLTTPYAYITSLFHDPFNTNGHGLYGYSLDTNHRWTIYSFGPDNVDNNWSIAYDPTNGITSEGDIWRRGP